MNSRSFCIPVAGKKPSPNSAARLTALAEWPPMIIGRFLQIGFGLQFTLSKLMNFPLNVAASSCHNFRIASIYSSVRSPRLLNCTFRASNSSLNHPTPMPSSIRPLVNLSIVARCFASMTGLR